MGRSKAKKYLSKLPTIPEEDLESVSNKGETVILNENTIIAPSGSETLFQNRKCDEISVVRLIKKTHCEIEKIDLWGNKHVFKLVLKTSLNSKDTFNQNNTLLDKVNTHRKEYIHKLIISKHREVTEDLIKNNPVTDKSRDVVIAINKAWTKQFIESLDVIITSDRIELTNARVYKFFNYRIVIKDDEGEKEQAAIDFIGLCWLFYVEKTITPGLEMDVVVNIKGFKMFFCIIVAIEFFNEMLKYPLLYAYYSKKKMLRSSASSVGNVVLVPNGNSEQRICDSEWLKLDDIKILSDEFGMIFYPTEKSITTFAKKFIEYYPNWKRVPFYTSF